MNKKQEEQFNKICPVKCEVFIGKEKIICDFSEYTPTIKQFISSLLQQQHQEITEMIDKKKKKYKEFDGKLPERNDLSFSHGAEIGEKRGYNQALRDIIKTLNK